MTATDPAPDDGVSAASDSAHTSIDNARQVFIAGQRRISVLQTSRLIGVLVLALVLWIGSWRAQTSFWELPSSWFLLALAVGSGLMTLIRWLGFRAASTDGAEQSPTKAFADRAAESKAAGARPEDTILCCSGGGIKSASFSLGALQQLSEDGIYQGAATVVGVSGGGYIASAYAALAGRTADRRPPFAPGSTELAALRRRTNYLASSPRVRYDLFVSMLFGIAVNALILAATAVVLAVFISDHARRTGVVETGAQPGDLWAFNPDHLGAIALLWPSALLAALSFCWFVIERLVGGAVGSVVRHGDGRPRLRRWREWTSSAPNTMLGCAVIFFMLYPAVPLLACQWHNWLLSSGISWGGSQNAAAAVIGFVGFVASVRSAWKGSEPGTSMSLPNRLLSFFRRRVVPWLGVSLATCAAYALIVGLTEAFLALSGTSPLWWIVGAGAVLLGLRALPGANVASMYPFYRDRLNWAFFQYGSTPTPPSPAHGTKRFQASPASMALHQLSSSPELVLCATASVTDGDVVPVGRNGTPFIMSSTQIGLTDVTLPGGQCLPAPGDYGKGTDAAVDFPLRLKDAVAISGAAVAPLGGREDAKMAPYRILLAMGNVRLGAWIRNPYWVRVPRPSSGWQRTVRAVNDTLDLASSLRVVREALGTPSINSPYLYVHDGGHYDNLGLVEALRRKPARIIMLDGTGDAEDHFTAMGDAIATARMDLGVEVSFEPSSLQRGERSHPLQGWVTAEATYPDRQTCAILYVKCVLPPHLSWDLEGYRLRNPGFPTTSNKYEMYDEFDFEAYRCLGNSIVADAVQKLANDPKWSEVLLPQAEFPAATAAMAPPGSTVHLTDALRSAGPETTQELVRTAAI